MEKDSQALAPAAGEPLRPQSPADDTARKTIMFGDQPIRVAMLDGAPHIIANDLCRALKLRIGNGRTSAKYLRSIPAEDRGYTPWPTSTGIKRCATISARGAVSLTRHRSRRIDPLVRRFVRSSIEPLAGAGDKGPKDA